MGTCFIFKLHAFGFHTKPNNRFEEEKNSHKIEKKRIIVQSLPIERITILKYMYKSRICKYNVGESPLKIV